MLFTDESRGRPFAKDPAVVKLGGRYLLDYTVPPYVGQERGYAIGIAESADMEHWENRGYLTPEQEAEKNGLCAPGAIVLNGVVHLFYQTYGNREMDAICHAVSQDGVRFRRDPSNPVFRPSDVWCCGRAIDADVTAFQGMLFLYFATRDKAFEIQMLGAAAADLNSDFSRSSWHEAYPGTILRPELEWEGKCIEAPAALSRDGHIYLFYGGAYNCSPQQIGCAVSEDGIRFTRLSDLPLIPNGKSGEWNSRESGHPYVFEDTDGSVQLFYQGADDQGAWQISRTEIKFEGGAVRPAVTRQPKPRKNG